MRLFLFFLTVFLFLSPLWWVGFAVAAYYMVRYVGYELVFVGVLLDALLGTAFSTFPFIYTAALLTLLLCALFIRPRIFMHE